MSHDYIFGHIVPKKKAAHPHGREALLSLFSLENTLWHTQTKDEQRQVEVALKK